MELNLNKSNWRKVRFGDVVKKVTNKIDPNGYDSDIVIQGGNINKRDFHIREYENKKELGYLGPAFHMGFKKEQILYVSRNPHLMKVGYPNFDGICANTTFIMETIDANVLRNDLIPFIMHSDTFIEQSVANVRGGVNPYVNWGDLACIEFLLPPKEEQAKLAKLLWVLDDIIESENELKKKSKTIRDAYFNNLIENSQGRKVPLSKILIPNKSKSKVPHVRDKYIGLEHIEPGEFETREYGNTESIKAQSNIVNIGDLCYSKLRPYLDKAIIATFDALSTTELLIYDTKLVSKKYVLYHLHSRPFLNYISEQGFGTKMPRVSHKIIGEFSILVPQNENLILKKMDSFLENLRSIKLKLLSSKSLQKSLINQIF
jgi:type I restriction enzyme, S subunit